MSVVEEQQEHRPACAACKHQRRKCSPDCVFAGHFTSKRTEDFKAALEVFGVKNMTKKLQSLSSEEEREKAVESFVWEAMAWKEDPVQGPLGLYKRIVDERTTSTKDEHRHQIVPYATDSGLIGLSDAGKENPELSLPSVGGFTGLLEGVDVNNNQLQGFNCNNDDSLNPRNVIDPLPRRFVNQGSVVNYNFDYNQRQVISQGSMAVNYHQERRLNGPIIEPGFGPRPKLMLTQVGDQAFSSNYSTLESNKRLRQSRENGTFNYGLPRGNDQGQGHF